LILFFKREKHRNVFVYLFFFFAEVGKILFVEKRRERDYIVENAGGPGTW
jgi:hypothetical protein